jgi:hypothetical protein
MAWQQVLALLLVVGCTAQVAQSFYLPGVAPQDFKKGDAIYLKVNKVRIAVKHACSWQEPCDIGKNPLVNRAAAACAAGNMHAAAMPSLHAAILYCKQYYCKHVTQLWWRLQLLPAGMRWRVSVCSGC